MDTLSQLLPIILSFAAGVGLLVLEALTPGFGVAGLSGVLLQGLTVYLVYCQYGLSAALFMAVIILAMIACAIALALRSVTKGKLSKSRIILRETESSENGYSTSNDMQSFVGREGEAATALRPSGIAVFDGVRLDVVTDGEFIDRGQKVVITQTEGARIIVKSC